MTGRRGVILAAVVAAALFAAWLGASVAGGYVAEAELREWAGRTGPQAGFRIANLRHERGTFTSSGSLDLQVRDACQDGPADGPAMRVDYRLDHLILPASLLRFDWRLAFAGSGKAGAARPLGIATELAGRGEVSFGGVASSSVSLPELSLSDAGILTRVSPVTGRFAIGRESLTLELQSERVVARGRGEALELRKLALSVDLRNRSRGTGALSLAVDGIATSEASAEGFRFLAEATERGDRTDVRVAPTLRALNVGGTSARDLALEIALKDLHSGSLETIQRIAGETCMTKNITVEEGRLLREAMRTLLASGFSVGIPRIGGAVGSGRLDGEVLLALDRGGSGDALDLAGRLRASGRLAVTGEAMSREQRNLLVALGLATESPEGLVAAFDYAGGLFKANGRVFDANEASQAIDAAERSIDAFLSAGLRPDAGNRIAAAPREVGLRNRSPEGIVDIRLAAAGDGNWGENLLADRFLAPGEEARIAPESARGCVYALRVVFASGEKDERAGVDLCATREVALGKR